MSDGSSTYTAAVNRLAKWRSIFAGWQLGTRPKGDPECDAVRDHREATLIQRCESRMRRGFCARTWRNGSLVCVPQMTAW